MIKKVTPTHKATHTVMRKAHTSRAIMSRVITTRMRVHTTPARLQRTLLTINKGDRRRQHRESRGPLQQPLLLVASQPTHPQIQGHRRIHHSPNKKRTSEPGSHGRHWRSGKYRKPTPPQQYQTRQKARQPIMPDGDRQRLNAPLHSPRGATFHGRGRTSNSHTMLRTTRASPRPQKLRLDSQLHRSSHGMRHKLPRKSLWQRRCSPTEENFIGTISLFRLYPKDSSQTGRIPGPHRPTTYKCHWRMLHMSSQTRTPTAGSRLPAHNGQETEEAAQRATQSKEG